MIPPSFPPSTVDPFITQATENRELFRLHATQAYHKFAPQQRRDIALIETNDIMAYSFFTLWSQRTLPALEELIDQTQDPAFRSLFAQRLLLDQTATAQKLDDLVSERRSELHNELLDLIYSESDNQNQAAKAREHATKLLAIPSSALQECMQHYESYLLYSMVASMYAIPITDPHSSWLRRRKTSRQIVIDREQVEANERAQLHGIDTQIEALLNSHSGLIKKLIDKDWDLITIISLRNNYEKRLKLLAPADAKKSLKRLALFEKVTKTFRDEQIEKHTTAEPQATLTSTRTIAQEIDTLLLAIFDLSNADKNSLLVRTKQARDLTEQRNRIISARAERNLLISTS